MTGAKPKKVERNTVANVGGAVSNGKVAAANAKPKLKSKPSSEGPSGAASNAEVYAILAPASAAAPVPREAWIDAPAATESLSAVSFTKAPAAAASGSGSSASDAKANSRLSSSFVQKPNRASEAKPLRRSATAGSIGGAGRSSVVGGAEKADKEKKDKAGTAWTAAHVLELALKMDARVEGLEQGSGAASHSLAVKLGEALLTKWDEGTKTKNAAKEFFRKMDKNGDGSISKMEFRQTMRELELMGGKSDFHAPDVDALYDSLDKDGSNDLDLDEITHGLKELRTTAKHVHSDEARRHEQAAYYKTRAETLRAQAEVVKAVEALHAELEEAKKAATGTELLEHKERLRKLKKQYAAKELEGKEAQHVAKSLVEEDERREAAEEAAATEAAAAAHAVEEAKKAEQEAKRRAKEEAAAAQAAEFEEKVKLRRSRRDSFSEPPPPALS